MKHYKIYLLAGWLVMLASCYKDKGNYSYLTVPAPVVKLDTVYTAIVGDSLVIAPKVTIAEEKPNLGFGWKIGVPEEARSLDFSGPVLRTKFGLKPIRYYARLTIIDSTNGMKYFYDFAIDGKTVYSSGTVVLSQDAGRTVLSFVKPDGGVQPDIYSSINDGEELPTGPSQVIGMLNQYNVPIVINSYWILCSNGDDPGVRIDANTFKKMSTLKGNFFSTPSSVAAGQSESSPNGVLEGVYNGKLYVGATQTWSGSPVYGMFGLPADGDYKMYRQAVFNSVMPYFLGYEVNRKQFIAFTNFGMAAYVGTGYQVTDVTAFDPQHVGLDMLYFQQINNNNCFAFMRGANDSVYRLKFGVAFIGVVQLQPMERKAFPRQDLIKAGTKWAGTPTEIFYFSSGASIYRYNPLNEEVRALTTDFGGKDVSMVKLSADGNTLTAGVSGSLYTLDVSTGHFGDVIKKIDGIPGAPVDAVVRN